MTSAKKIRKGEYTYQDKWIVKTENGWEVRSEVTGEVYETCDTLKEAKIEADYIAKWNEDEY